jgi:hypothetical protein
MAMVCTPHCASQSANWLRSAVHAPNERTCAGRLAGWLAGAGGAFLRGHRHPMHLGVNVNAGGMEVRDLQRIASTRGLRLAWGHGGLQGEGTGKGTRGRERGRA